VSAAVSQAPHPGLKVPCNIRRLKIPTQTIIDSRRQTHEVWLKDFRNGHLLGDHVCHQPASDGHIGVQDIRETMGGCVVRQFLRQTVGPPSMSTINANLIHQPFRETVTDGQVSLPHAPEASAASA
jgi:hypothetical protein